MNILIIIFITIFIYFFVAVIFRILGKREVGQLGTFDLVVFLLIAELIAIALDMKENFFLNLLPVIVLALIQILISKLSLKSIKIRTFIDGKPSVIIKNGIINFRNMVDQRYNLDDLLLQLREKDVRSIDEVEYAILETNGNLSVFKKDDKNNNTYPLPIIIDGDILYNNLIGANKNKKWLLDILVDKKININDVFYAFIKENNLYIIKYDEVSK